MPIRNSTRGYAASTFALELDGVNAGWLASARGGDATSDVVEEKLGPDMTVKKHLAGVKYSDIEIACGTGMSKGFFDWLRDTFDRRHTRKNGAIVSTDYNGREVSRLSFLNALVTEIAFPTLDAASKDVAKLTVKFSPEYTRSAKGGGGAVKGDGGGYKGQQVQKKWLPSNFRLKIDGLDCTRVNKIEALVIKQKLVENPVGEIRDYEKEPAHAEIPDLVITMAESHADDFVRWHEEFVIKGNNGEDREKNGTLEFLAPNMQEVLFTLGFRHLGIFKLTQPDSPGAGAESISRLQAFMYCEEMTFTPGAGAGALATSVGAMPAATGAPSGSAGAAPDTGSTPVFVGAQEPPLVVVSGANGPVVTEDIPERFTRIRRTL